MLRIQVLSMLGWLGKYRLAGGLFTWYIHILEVTGFLTSAVFVIDQYFDEPMEYPRGANYLICSALASPPNA